MLRLAGTGWLFSTLPGAKLPLPTGTYRLRNYVWDTSPNNSNLKTEVLKEIDDQRLLFCLRSLQYSHRDTWKRLKALYESGPPPEPHRYQPGDWVYVRCHHQETLEPRWKGPFLVVLTTPTALKVDSISTWVHYTHVRPADLLALREEFLPQWKTKLDKTNPLKLKLQR